MPGVYPESRGSENYPRPHSNPPEPADSVGVHSLLRACLEGLSQLLCYVP